MSEEKQQINTNDQTAVKQLLDDVIMETTRGEGYEEDHTISNIKLLVGTIACLFALLSHFYPLPFPENLFILQLCCVGYFLCSAFLQYVSYFNEKDIILSTKPKEVGKGKKKRKCPLQISTSFPKYDEHFTIRIVSKNENGPSSEKSLTASIAKWFDTEGVLAKDVFVNDVKGLIVAVDKDKEE